MSSPNTPQNAASPLLRDYRPVVAPPSLEQQAQNLVSAMQYWNDLVEFVWRRDPYYREQMDELSRLYRRAHREWLRICRQLGRIPAAFVPGWVDDYYTES